MCHIFSVNCVPRNNYSYTLNNQPNAVGYYSTNVMKIVIQDIKIYIFYVSKNTIIHLLWLKFAMNK